jgi:hypothetical protein
VGVTFGFVEGRAGSHVGGQSADLGGVATRESEDGGQDGESGQGGELHVCGWVAAAKWRLLACLTVLCLCVSLALKI